MKGCGTSIIMKADFCL